jgi:hypothetical protein
MVVFGGEAGDQQLPAALVDESQGAAAGALEACIRDRLAERYQRF